MSRAGLALVVGATVAYLAFTLPQMSRPLMYDDANFADVVAHQPQNRAQLLQVLSRLVHRRTGVLFHPVAKLLERVVRATLRDPPDPGDRTLLATQAIGAGLSGVGVVAGVVEHHLGRDDRGARAGGEAGGEPSMSVLGCAGNGTLGAL